jgi:hypothetical protein
MEMFRHTDAGGGSQVMDGVVGPAAHADQKLRKTNGAKTFACLAYVFL